nr:MAG TPA: hypothetical protein [Caudoviricetes sp.]
MGSTRAIRSIRKAETPTEAAWMLECYASDGMEDSSVLEALETITGGVTGAEWIMEAAQ